MPLYEYLCADCGHRFDIRQSINDERLTICPSCGGSVRRVIQPVGIVFKGSGFYKTDSRSSSEASMPAGERKEEKAAAPSGSTETASSTTPAAPPAPAKPAGGDATPVS